MKSLVATVGLYLVSACQTSEKKESKTEPPPKIVQDQTSPFRAKSTSTPVAPLTPTPEPAPGESAKDRQTLLRERIDKLAFQAMEQLNQRLYEGAVATLLQLIRLDVKNDSYRLALAKAYLAQERLDLGARVLEDVNNKESTVYRLLAAQLAWQQQKFSVAEALLRALAQTPVEGQRDALLNLAIMGLSHGRYAQVLLDTEKLLQLAADFPEAKMIRVVALWQTGKTAEAEAMLSDLHSRFPEHYLIFEFASLMSAYHGKTDLAREQLQKAIELARKQQKPTERLEAKLKG